MSDEYRVELIAPDGRTFVSRSAMDTNDLIYGQGYRLAEQSTQDKESAGKSAPEAQ